MLVVQGGALGLSFGPFLAVGLSLSGYFLVVGLVSVCVLVWGLDYLSGDPKFNSFFLFTSSFVSSMLVFTLADSSFLVLACFDLLGFTSYFLIAHYGSSRRV